MPLPFLRRKRSSTVAKDRLTLVLMNDRVSCDNQLVEQLRKEIIAVIEKYTSTENVSVEFTPHSDDVYQMLLANIPLKHKTNRTILP